MVTTSAPDPLVVVLKVVITATGQVTGTTASKAQGTTVMMVLWSCGGGGGNEGRIPAEGDRFQPADGQFDC